MSDKPRRPHFHTTDVTAPIMYTRGFVEAIACKYAQDEQGIQDLRGKVFKCIVEIHTEGKLSPTTRAELPEGSIEQKAVHDALISFDFEAISRLSPEQLVNNAVPEMNGYAPTQGRPSRLTM